MPSAIVDSDTNAQFDGHPNPDGNPGANRNRGGHADGNSVSNGEHPSPPVTHSEPDSGCFRGGYQEAAQSLREWFP